MDHPVKRGRKGNHPANPVNGETIGGAHSFTFCESILAVPSRTCLPEDADIGRAVRAVLGVRKAASIVPGRPP